MISATFVRFGVIGAIGFLVDATVLTVLSAALGVDVFLSRFFSISAAVTITWLLNRKHVFGSDRTGTDKALEYGQYLTVQIIGALINLGLFALLVIRFPALREIPVVPLALAASVALVFNYLSARYWVYRE